MLFILLTHSTQHCFLIVSENFSCRPQLLLCWHAANVLRAKEHCHVIIIHLFLAWSCPLCRLPLREITLSVMFSVNFLPWCCVSVSVFSSLPVHVKSQRLVDVYELLVAKTSLLLYIYLIWKLSFNHNEYTIFSLETYCSKIWKT